MLRHAVRATAPLLVARAPSSTRTMALQHVATDKAPAAIG